MGAREDVDAAAPPPELTGSLSQKHVHAARVLLTQPGDGATVNANERYAQTMGSYEATQTKIDRALRCGKTGKGSRPIYGFGACTAAHDIPMSLGRRDGCYLDT